MGTFLNWMIPLSWIHHLVHTINHIIVVLRCMVEIGRIYINTEVSMLAFQLALTIEGHLEAALNIFS